MYVLDKSKKVFDIENIGQNDIFCVYISNEKCVLIINIVQEDYLEVINCIGAMSKIYPEDVQSMDKLYDYSEEV